MRKFILFFILACLHVATRGQTIEGVDLSVLPKPTQAARLQYWFDDDIASLSSQTQVGGTHSIDVSSLLTGVHTIRYQIIDDKGKVGVPYSALFIKTAQCQLEANELRYWFNDDDKSAKRTSLQNGISTIDVSNIGVGLHTLHYQILDSHNSLLYIASAMFMNMGENLGDGTLRAERLLYWYDDEEKLNNAEISSGIKTLDASHLPEGLHTLHYQVLCNNGSLTVASSAFFFRVNSDTSSAKAKQLRYWYDDQTSVLTASITSGTQMLDVSGLLAGIHVLHYQIVDDSGALGVPSSTMFMKMDAMEELAAAKSQRYWFDDDESNMRECAVANGVQELDVQNLEVGFHTLHYQLVDAAGNVTVPYSNVFMKTHEYALIDGKNAITRYQYWINDDATLTTVDVAKPTSPYQLISLLPMPKAPICSSRFHFESKDGEPMIYAKNDVHFRFFDAAGYWGDEARSFIDYNVSQKVTNVTGLTSAQTFERPEENGIKWFKFEAEYGDSIAIKCNQATSVQIFNSSGKELYYAHGSSSVTYGGCHLFEDGTFFVAVHDVTGSNNNVTLESKRIDKYALFDFTPNRMSGVGKTIMYFKGNGFEHIKSIELYNDEICIKPDTIVTTISDMLARFSTTEELSSPIKMSLKLFFCNSEKEESKTIIIDNAVILEPVNHGNIDVSIVTEHRVGDPFPVKVSIKNKGNIGSYGIPINIAYDNVDKLDEFDFVNFDLLLSEELYQSKDFFTYTDNLLGKGKKGFFMPLLIPYIGPYEEVTLVFGVKTKIAHAKFNFYAWAGEPWYAPRAVDNANSSAKARRAPNNDPCDGSNSNTPRLNDIISSNSDNNNSQNRPGEPFDPDLLYGPGNIADELTDLPLGPGQTLRPWLGVGEAIAGIIQGLTRANEDATMKNAGIDPSDPANDIYRFHYRYQARSPREIWNDANPFQARQRNIFKAKATSDGRKSIDEYASSPCPDPEPHPTDVWIPGDPNEMTGYTSESGSRYMTDRIKNVSYDIEFENDPKLANSAAHIILIENQLDPNIFDLNTFTPKDITISGRKIELDGEKSFVKTIDLRPEINAIGELSCDYNVQTGFARWTFTSLDPMTMELTDDIMQGILPVNYDGSSGKGSATYSVDLKHTFSDGTQISNKASIVFDTNDAIETPVWTNTIDAIAPTSKVTDVEMKNDSTFTIHFEGDDARSGIWKYDVYYRWKTDMDWICIANGCDSTAFDKTAVVGYTYQFCVVATDSAGNVEQKSLTPEFEFSTSKPGDVNGDGKVTISDAVKLIDHCKASNINDVPLDIWDVNDDGIVNMLDVVEIIKILLDSAQTQDSKLRDGSAVMPIAKFRGYIDEENE